MGELLVLEMGQKLESKSIDKLINSYKFMYSL